MQSMWMSELATRCALPVPTIKYYLREGLLHPGEAVGATRARYDESHVRRLRLVRALIEVARLRVDDVRAVLAAVDDPGVSLHDALGSAHGRLSPAAAPAPGAAQDAADEQVEALLDRHDWELDPTSRHRLALATSLESLASLGHPVSDAQLDVYARAADLVASADLAALDDSTREDAAEHAVVGTLLLEPVLLALRRIAHENTSRRRAW